MNEQLQSKLVEILAGIQSAVKTGADFALSQLPDIAQQYVIYGRVVHTAALIAAVALFAISVYVLLRHAIYSKTPNQHGYWADSRVFILFIGCIGTGASFVAAAHFVTVVAMVWFAPKVWLLKELAALVK